MSVFARFELDAETNGGPVVASTQVLELAQALHDDGFTFFVTCVSIHREAVEADEEGQGALPDRTEVCYRLRKLPTATRKTESISFRVIVPTGDSTPSLAGIWVGADWNEREQFDLVGTVFAGHPDLRRIMMPEDWPGHPLRRDYAIETAHFPWR